jgi:hypothetical protein
MRAFSLNSETAFSHGVVVSFGLTDTGDILRPFVIRSRHFGRRSAIGPSQITSDVRSSVVTGIDRQSRRPSNSVENDTWQTPSGVLGCFGLKPGPSFFVRLSLLPSIGCIMSRYNIRLMCFRLPTAIKSTHVHAASGDYRDQTEHRFRAWPLG